MFSFKKSFSSLVVLAALGTHSFAVCDGDAIINSIAVGIANHMERHPGLKDETDWAMCNLDLQYDKIVEIEKILEELVKSFEKMMMTAPKPHDEKAMKELVKPLRSLYQTHYFTCSNGNQNGGLHFGGQYPVTLHCLSEHPQLKKVLVIEEADWDFDAYKHNRSPIAEFSHKDAAEAYNAIGEIKKANIQEHNYIVQDLFQKAFSGLQ